MIFDIIWNDAEMYAVQQMLLYSFIGSGDNAKAQMQSFVNSTRVDEIMVVSNIFDHAARVRSYELIA